MKSGNLYGSLPRRYARAMVQIAQEENAVEAYGRALEDTVKSLEAAEGASSFLKTLSDDTIDFNERLRAIEEISDRMGVPILFKNFLSLLVKKERIGLLPEIAREYQRLQDDILGIVRVAVVTPAQPAEDLLRRVEGVLSGRLKKKVMTHGESDPSLIGGLVLRVDHTVYDGSIRKELERIKNAMINA